jgi:hypothetical protein
MLAGVAVITLIHFDLYESGAAHNLADVFPFAYVAFASLLWSTWEDGHKLIWAVLAVFVIAVTIAAPTWGGGGWGPRLLLPAYPLLAILAWRGLWTCPTPILKGACVALLATSVLVQALGLRHLSQMQTETTALLQELNDLQPRVLATGVWWLPQLAASTQPAPKWYGLAESAEGTVLRSAEPCFWWIWSNEDAAPDELPLHHIGSPVPGLPVREKRTFSARDLEGALYCEAPSDVETRNGL